MRRLPIYFLIDVSESMIGEPIDRVQDGMAAIIKELRADPYALETVWVSVIAFAGQSKTIAPLQEVISFYPPKFPVGSGTSLCSGLGHLMYELKKNIVPNTTEQKGDWKPIVFLFTDGVPTDSPSDLHAVITEWKQKWQQAANLVAVSFGKSTDTGILGELTDHVLYFENSDANAYKEFFKWVTASIKTSSVSVENNSTGFELARLNDHVSKIDLSKKNEQSVTDDNFVVLVAKCQNTKNPYLIKYRKNVFENESGDIAFDYRLVGAFRVDNSYFEMSDENAGDLKISTDKLKGAPTCPCCGNQYGFAYDETCGKIHCIGTEKISTCPWCGNQAQYGFGDRGFDVNRTRG
ncbi:MAG: VWA domain-containing protein [Candidatus Azobacteroides sp.]|nr:VWA domain-containing protein [Candidatus Azobacteroides sp.]